MGKVVVVDDLLLSPASAQACAIREGRTSSRELVEGCLERIERLNPKLNAVVTVDPDSARRAADDCDRARACGVTAVPLHGVPVTVKDAFATMDLRTTAGSRNRAHLIPNADAVVVARLRAAGAVVLGKTNVPEDVTGQETANALFGRTCNPWDTGRTTGGSSGGAAAAVAAGLSALDVGSDKGGSIRQPAAYCGVYGHYSTHGIVPLRGHLPSIDLHEIDVHGDLTVAGPIARSAADLALALDVLAGPDPLGMPGWRLELPAAVVQHPTDLRVAVWATDDAFPTCAAVRERIESAADALQAAGARVDRRARPDLSLVEAERVAFALWVAAGASDLDDDAFANLLVQAEATDPADDSRAARRVRAVTARHRDWQRLDAERRRLQRAWAAFFADIDVLLCPVSPVVAPLHDPEPAKVDSIDRRLQRTITVDGQQRPYLDQLVWNIVVGSARLPATVIPLGLDSDGLPIGAQIVGPAHGDRTTIAVAGILAEFCGGYQPPPCAT
jgi:amidase